ncbi:unnamed protein product, partial [Polarella glacialis]
RRLEVEIDFGEASQSVCVPGVIGGACFFAGVFGALGAALQGQGGLSQLAAQAFGGALGAYACANMHKGSEVPLSVRRVGLIFLSSSGGTAASMFALPAEMDLWGLSVLFTALGGSAMALATDPDLTPFDIYESMWPPTDSEQLEIGMVPAHG